jgi:hypothetical protein
MQLRALGMMACFVVSGLVHEVMYWYCQRSTTGLWLVFFSLQVRCRACKPAAFWRPCFWCTSALLLAHVPPAAMTDPEAAAVQFPLADI